MPPVDYAFLSMFGVLFRPQLSLRAENVAPRHQLAVYRRTVKRSIFRPEDRILWSWLSRCWTRWRDDIAETLQQAPEHYEPLLMENPNNGDPIPIIDEWCSGFMKGVQLDSDGWLPVVTGKPGWISTITL